MKSSALTLMLALWAAPALAQNACVTPPPVGDPCMVGHWVGENTAPARIRAALQGMVPEDVIRDIAAGASPTLGISIYDDGFYHTLPFHQATEFTDTFVETGDVVDVRLDLAAPTQVGFINGESGRVTFCDAGSAPAMFTMTANGDVMTAPVAGAERYEPTITYTCRGDTMGMDVQLPAPIGTVQYFLRRVPEDAFGEEFRRVRDVARDLAE
ncbi:hypothetical protein [Roseovarius sp.]|uniref:hypothetical protein n=1 Tax=Roseovarius sp. TaxID=1486281 RepID=UPI003D107CC9